MNHKTRNQLLFLMLLVMAFVIVKIYKSCCTSSTSKTTTDSGAHQNVISPDTKLTFTRHAKCRMSCRHISEADIREVLREGRVNPAKSNDREGHCPTYAIEDDLSDGTQLRIVFAKCDRQTKVVTCIDRTHDYTCDCD